MIIALSDEEFAAEFQKLGPAKLARKLNQSVRNMHARRVKVEDHLRRQITAPSYHNGAEQWRSGVAHPGRLFADVKNGTVLVGSDCHYWPGDRSLMHRAFVNFCKDIQPAIVVMNGDVCDFAKISRHPPPGWGHQPSPKEEIEVAQERLAEIESVAFKSRKIWTFGNHDQRYERFLAMHAKEFLGVQGTSLREFFPTWEPCWSLWLNPGDERDTVVIKHRGKGGAHATYNNVRQFRAHVVSSHLHSANIRPVTDIKRYTLYGVDTGCIADPHAQAFADYTEDGVTDWRDSFCVLTFKDGRLLQPELVLRFGDKHVQFRGKVIGVS